LEAVVADDDRRPDLRLEVRLREQVEREQHRVAGKRAGVLLPALHHRHQLRRIRGERVVDDRALPVVRVVEELRPRGEREDADLLPARGRAGRPRRERDCDERGADDTGLQDAHRYVPSSWKSRRCFSVVTGFMATWPLAPTKPFVPPVTASVNDVWLKSTGPDASNVPLFRT